MRPHRPGSAVRVQRARNSPRAKRAQSAGPQRPRAPPPADAEDLELLDTEALDAVISELEDAQARQERNAPSSSEMEDWYRLRAKLHASRNLGALADAVIKRTMRLGGARSPGNRQEAMVATYMDVPSSPKRERSPQRVARDIREREERAEAESAVAELEKQHQPSSPSPPPSSPPPKPEERPQPQRKRKKKKKPPQPRPEWRSCGRAAVVAKPQRRPPAPQQQQQQQQQQPPPPRPARSPPQQDEGDKLVAVVEKQRQVVARLTRQWQGLVDEVEERRVEIAQVLANTPSSDTRMSAAQRIERHTALWEHRLNKARIRNNQAITRRDVLRSEVNVIKELKREADEERDALERAIQELEGRKDEVRTQFDAVSEARQAAERRLQAAKAKRSHEDSQFGEEERQLRVTIDARADPRAARSFTPKQALRNSPAAAPALTTVPVVEETAEAQRTLAQLRRLTGAKDVAEMVQLLKAQSREEAAAYESAQQLVGQSAELEREVAAFERNLKAMSSPSSSPPSPTEAVRQALERVREERAKHDVCAALLAAAEVPMNGLLEAAWRPAAELSLTPPRPSSSSSSSQSPSPSPSACPPEQLRLMPESKENVMAVLAQIDEGVSLLVSRLSQSSEGCHSPEGCQSPLGSQTSQGSQ